MEIWLINRVPYNLILMHAAVSEKPELTDDGQMTDGRPHYASSSAELKPPWPVTQAFYMVNPYTKSIKGDIKERNKRHL